MSQQTASKSHGSIPLSAGMLLVTLGVVYGDIGTSPMYVMKAIVNGNGGIASVTEELILGALSLVIWTITLVTTVKYVVIAMKADNHGEGGIFALYSLVRKCARWLIIPAMVGGAGLVHFIENPGGDSRAQSAARPHVLGIAQQPRRPAHPRLRVLVHDRCRGLVFRHGPRRQVQHLCELAVCEALPDP